MNIDSIIIIEEGKLPTIEKQMEEEWKGNKEDCNLICIGCDNILLQFKNIQSHSQHLVILLLKFKLKLFYYFIFVLFIYCKNFSVNFIC